MMKTVRIKKGLDVPLKGKPDMAVHSGPEIRRVGVSALDFPGLKPRLKVSVGDTVAIGDPIFIDKDRPGIRFTAPAAGTITEINRGDRRVLESVVIDVSGDASREFFSAPPENPEPDEIRRLLLESGLWPVIRMRPFDLVADPDVPPRALFITAMDSHPHAPAAMSILDGQEEAYRLGVRILSRLAGVRTFICRDPETTLPRISGPEAVTEVVFSGPHPAGNVGTHIHFLSPVCRGHRVWHIGLQDLLAVGAFFQTGRLSYQRVVSLAGPAVNQPRLLRTRLGASIDELTVDELIPGKNRVISGSVLTGFAISGGRTFLGRYHQQISVLREGGRRRFLGWLSPGRTLFSTKGVVISRFLPRRDLDLTTELHGGLRAIIPSGVMESVVPMDILPTMLMRALMSDDIEDAEKLGIMELTEEDVALCSFVSASKIDFGEALRRNLTTILKEG